MSLEVRSSDQDMQHSTQEADRANKATPASGYLEKEGEYSASAFARAFAALPESEQMRLAEGMAAAVGNIKPMQGDGSPSDLGA